MFRSHNLVLLLAFAFIANLRILAQTTPLFDSTLLKEISNDESYDWQLVREQNDLKVYLRAVDGTDLKQSKATVIVNASPQEILSLLTSPERNPEWIPNYVDSKRLKTVSPNEYFAYTKVMSPFYAQNRDIVFNTSFQLLEHGFIIKSVGVADYISEVAGFVRIPRFDVNWIAKDLGHGQTMVTQHLIVAPGGNVSARVANSNLGNSVFKTISNLQAHFEQSTPVASNTQTKRRFLFNK